MANHRSIQHLQQGELVKDIKLHFRSVYSTQWVKSAAWRTPWVWGSSLPTLLLPDEEGEIWIQNLKLQTLHLQKELKTIYIILFLEWINNNCQTGPKILRNRFTIFPSKLYLLFSSTVKHRGFPFRVLHILESCQTTTQWLFSVSHLEDFHLEAAVRRGSIRHLQSLHKCLCELLHHREDQRFGCTLYRRFSKYNCDTTANLQNISQTLI